MKADAAGLWVAPREECRPNTTSFTTVIDAWSKSGHKNAYDHALKMFQQMQSMRKGAEPNTFAYNSLMNALAISSVPDKATKAFNMLLEMDKMAKEGNIDVVPSMQTYGVVVKACARTYGNKEAKRRALRVALEAFDKFRRDPNFSTNPMIYDSLFITIALSSRGGEYAKLVTQVFKLCCEDGALNDFILRHLRKNTPRDVYYNLIGARASSGGRDVSVADLPAEWSANAEMRS
jgi:hypothetical protein